MTCISVKTDKYQPVQVAVFTDYVLSNYKYVVYCLNVFYYCTEGSSSIKVAGSVGVLATAFLSRSLPSLFHG
ncbi:MAG: hypothetical protein RLZZ367_688 [Bacteroidota bacterium]|jgi:hypothetical protein